jgi:hypothetical protein
MNTYYEKLEQIATLISKVIFLQYPLLIYCYNIYVLVFAKRKEKKKKETKMKIYLNFISYSHL